VGFPGGCPVAAVGVEAAAAGEARVSCCESVCGAWAEGLSVALERWGVAPQDCLPVAEFAICALQGAILLAKVRRDARVLDSVARQLAGQISQSIRAERP